MKKILLATAIVLTFGLTTNAQSDGFFRNYNSSYSNRESIDIAAPEHGLGGHAQGNGEEAPLGSGLLVLTALGAGYAVARKRKK